MSAPMRPSLHAGEFGVYGLAVVAAMSLVMMINETARILVAEGAAVWLPFATRTFVLNIGVGLAILGAAVWVRHRFPEPGPRQYAAAVAAVTLAAGVAILVAFAWSTGGTLGSDRPDWTPGSFVYDWGTGVLQTTVLGLAVTAAWLYTRAESDHAAAIARCAVDVARMDEQVAEARLQMLEAQIEPHFLFNTLAHVKRLYETDEAAGARMMDNLKAYLAVALPQMRATDSTLGREIEHAQAYLEIQQIRMGPRLAFAIEVDARLRTARMPPLMLLTLVENAIKHGLTPRVSGGRVEVRARVQDGQLRVVVADTGGGFTRSGGGGTGLANIRARLATQYGAKASLSLASNTPSGVVATIALPHVPAGIPEAGS
jgi:signal transduction histidine kinase